LGTPFHPTGRFHPWFYRLIPNKLYVMKRFSRRNMIWPVLLGATLVTGCAGQTTRTIPEAVARPVLTVLVYNAGSASERDISDLERSATSVFKRAGIEMTWLNCSQADLECDTIARSDVSGQASVRLRVVDRPDRGGVHMLGWTTPNSSSITVLYTRAQRLARASTSGVSTGEVLGHVVAHEIGHVFLGSNSHCAFGVMKSSYNNQDIVNMVQGGLRFSAQDTLVLRARLSSVSEPGAKTAGE
jgi:hypothetical protein